MFLYLLISIFFEVITLSHSNQQIVCPVITYNGINSGDVSFNGIVNVTYDRENLFVYEYHKLRYVNVMFEDVQLNFKGLYSIAKNVETNASIVIKTTALGSAQLEKNKFEVNVTNLVQCELDFTKNAMYSNVIPKNKEEIMINAVTECVQQKLCSAVNPVVLDDYLRADIAPHDFANNSAAVIDYSEKYSNLAASYEKPNKAISETEKTLNLMLDVLTSYGISQISKKEFGKIEFPNVTETVEVLIISGEFHLLNGIVGDLNKITRAQNTALASDGLQFSVEVAYEIPKPYVRFEEVEFKLPPLYFVKDKLYATLDKLYFKIKVIINFNKTPCKVEVSEIDIEIGKISLQVSSALTLVINVLSSKFDELMKKHITSFAKTKVNDTLQNLLNNFDCENFRP